MNRHFRALGRLKKGQRNKTEAAYERHLELLLHAGEILWYRFESVTLTLATRCSYTADFMVVQKDGTVELHDVKGSRKIVQDDALVKMKIVARDFPFVMKMVFPVKGGGWETETL